MSVYRGHTSMVFGLLLLATLAMVVFGSTMPQTTQVNGTVKLKQADGSVMVNGTSAISGATIFSDSTVTTAKGSSAVVSLGKLGRVEILPATTMKLSFTDDSFGVTMLEAGRVRLSTSSGVNATATTRDGQVFAGNDQKIEFMVDTTCGDTLVTVRKGRVELRAGNSVKQIAAGGQDTAGQSRPGCKHAGRD